MKLNRLASVAIATVATAGLAVGLLSPANAAPKTTVQIVQSNALTGLNPSVSSQNLTFNTDVDYLEQIGFTYYNNKATLVDNTAFGTYKVVSQKPYKVQYTVNKGRLWSDGTTINGIDLLLSHVTSAGTYSQIAGLGDPSDSEVSPAFDSLGYGGLYEQHVVGLPQLSADKMSVTIEYGTKVPDWRLLAPGPFPVHALMLMAEGKKKLGTVAENNAARERFYKAFDTYNTASLKKMGAIWSKDYNVNQVNASTNPLLLVGNGPFKIQSAVANGAVTMVRNPSYNSGPKVKALQRVVFKVIGDGTAAAQALANGELDIYAGQATADGVAKLKAIKNVNVVGKDDVAYEHWDLHYDTAPDEAPYTGLFSVKDGAKSKALRQAFLLALPREEIMQKLIAPINGQTKPIGSTWLAPGSAAYDKLIAANGSAFYSRGTQETRNKSALALVQKYYPNALKNPLKVRVLVPGNNPRRASEFALAKANMAKVGFNLVGEVRTDWPSKLGNSDYDAYFFAWVASSVTQRQSAEVFDTNGGNNILGYSNKAVDAIIATLDAPMSESLLLAKYIQIERLTNADAITAGVFIHPGVVAINKDLKNVKPGPLSPTMVWNYWEWTY